MLKHQCRAKFRFPKVEHPEDSRMIDALKNTELAHRHAAEALSLIGRCSTRVRINPNSTRDSKASVLGNEILPTFALTEQGAKEVVAYSYGDPNIQTVLVEARRLAERATLPHWMLTTAYTPTNGQEALRQELWKADLARIGIRCVLMKDYASIEAIVSRIARMSRGPTLYVTGSHTGSDPRAADVGRLLADPNRPRAILLDGQSTGVSRTVLSQFQTACIEQRVDLNERLKFFPNPYATNPSFSNDPSLLPLLKQWRGTMLRKANSALVFDGGMGTEAEAEIALELGCRIIPAPQSRTGCAYRLLDNPTVAQDLNQRCPGYITAAKDLTLSAEAIVDCILKDMPPWPR
jgi:hypothetical protein